MRYLAQLIFLLSLATAFHGCKTGGSDSSGPSNPAAPVVDPGCGSKALDSCSSTSNCATNGAVCSGTAAYCNGFATTSACPSSSCVWTAANSKCDVLTAPLSSPSPSTVQPSTVTPSCQNYSTVDTCGAILGCAWTGISCVLTTSLPTATTTTVPPTPSNYCAPLNTATLCAAGPACTWNGTSCTFIGGGSAVQPKSCSPLNTAEYCAAGLGCQWNATNSSCLRPGAGFGTPFQVGDGLSNIGTATNSTANCNFSAILGTDGKLRLYQGSVVLWASPNTTPGATLQFQKDGNLVIYSSSNTVVWSANTQGKGAVAFTLSTAGLLSVTGSAGFPVWQTGVSVQGCN